MFSLRPDRLIKLLKELGIVPTNRFVSRYADVSSIGSLSSLTYISLGTNLLTGTIPSSIGAFTRLSYLLLGTNSLTGTIPSSIGSLTSLYCLDLHSNRLAGTIPSTFSNLIILQDLNLDTNYLTMGSAATVSKSTFSSATLSGTLVLSSNCLAFHYNSILVTATHCAPTSGKSIVLYEYEYVLSMKAAYCSGER